LVRWKKGGNQKKPKSNERFFCCRRERRKRKKRHRSRDKEGKEEGNWKQPKTSRSWSNLTDEQQRKGGKRGGKILKPTEAIRRRKSSLAQPGQCSEGREANPSQRGEKAGSSSMSTYFPLKKKKDSTSTAREKEAAWKDSTR